MAFQPGANLYTASFGTRPENVEVPHIDLRAPATTDVNFPIGKRWIDYIANTVYTLTSLTASQGSVTANWEEVSSTGNLNTLTTQDSTVVTPSASNIDISGSGTITTTGSGHTVTISPSVAGYPITPYVVGPPGQAGYQTIQAAVNAIGANGSGQIWLYPGTYIENLTFPNGINVGIITGSDEDAGSAFITGTHTPPLNGNIITWRVGLNSGASGHIFNSSGAGTATITCVHNNFVLNGYIFNLPNWTGELVIGLMADRSSTSSGIINNTGGASFLAFESTLGVGTTYPMIASGFTIFEVCNISCPVQLSGSGSSINFYDSNFFANTQLGGATTGFIVNSFYSTGSNASITYNSSANTILSNVVIQSTNNPAINGTSTGTLQIGSITFMNNSTIAGTVTTSWGTFQTGSSIVNGNSVIAGAGHQLQIHGGAVTDFIGTATLTAGTVTIANTNIAATDRIFIQRQSVNGSTILGELTYTITATTSFTITSVILGTPGSTQTADTSIVSYFIVRQVTT